MVVFFLLFACQEKDRSDVLLGDSEFHSTSVDCVGFSLEECPEECNILIGIPEVEAAEGSTCIDSEMGTQPASCGEYAASDEDSPEPGRFFAEDDSGVCWMFSSSFTPTGWGECGPIDDCQ